MASLDPDCTQLQHLQEQQQSLPVDFLNQRCAYGWVFYEQVPYGGLAYILMNMTGTALEES